MIHRLARHQSKRVLVMAKTAGLFYLRSFLFDARSFASTAAVSRHSSPFPTQAKSLGVLITKSYHSSLIPTQKSLAGSFFGRRSIFDAASSRYFRLSNPFCRGTRSLFSGSADKTGANSSPPHKEVDPQLTTPPDSSTAPKEDMQAITKEIMEAANNAVNSVREATTAAVSWVQETKENVLPVIKERFDPSEYMSETVTQLAYTTIAAVLAWFVMPRLFRLFHRYFEDGSTFFLKRTDKVPYELSVWAALEDPARILFTVVAFSQLGALIAPSTIASHYLEQIWKGGAVVALVWFLHRWKSNVLSRLLASRSMSTVERERYLALDKISSMGLFILGGMAIAETCGVAVQSILTIGGIGGVATAFAARDILGNMLSGVALQFSKPFSIGDTIKAGSVEGQVLDIGLTATQLLDNDKFPVAVPNSFLSTQVIVNKSRAPSRAFTVKIPVHLKDFEKIPQITQEVRDMLKKHPNVLLQNGVPYCYVARVVGSSMELIIYCNLKPMPKEELFSTEQEIILRTIKIATNVGATLGALET